MGQPFIGEIRMFGGGFAPAGWAFCEGQLLPIAENETLFVLIGTTYGGDGQETFGLPDLRGRAPVHQGTSTTGTSYQLAEQGGAESVTITPQQLPVHRHALHPTMGPGSANLPGGLVPAVPPTMRLYDEVPTTGELAPRLTAVGGSQPHENMQPYLVVSFIISLFGIFPQQA